MLPVHGKLKCHRCFSNAGDIKSVGNWQFRNDPGYWGSSTPTILVLGFCKGAAQADVYATGSFDDVAFTGCRPRLKQILTALGLLAKEGDFDRKFCVSETRFGFASLLRCSAAVRSDETGRISTSGPIILRAFREPEPRRMLVECSRQFLFNFPEQLKLIVMLGVQNGYIKECRRLINALHPGTFHLLNDAAYSAGGVVWVHATHPSKLNGHFNDWVNGDSRHKPMARKRDLVIDAIKRVPGLLV